MKSKKPRKPKANMVVKDLSSFLSPLSEVRISLVADLLICCTVY